MGRRYRFSADVWEHDGSGSWHFLSVPEAEADDIEQRASGARRGFGSVRVEVRIGATTWRTSLFPDAARATYVLPVKRSVRLAEGIVAGSRVDVVLEIVS